MRSGLLGLKSWAHRLKRLGAHCAHAARPATLSAETPMSSDEPDSIGGNFLQDVDRKNKRGLGAMAASSRMLSAIPLACHLPQTG